MDEKERVASANACKYVDEVIFPAPWFPSTKFLKDHNIDFTAHDALPYESGGVSASYLELKKEGMFLPTLRTTGLSTTNLITRILKRKVKFFLIFA
jgi:choline-phosphate cytidylyltransferase